MQQPARPTAALPVAVAAEALIGLVLGGVLAAVCGIGIGYLARFIPALADLGMGLLIVMLFAAILGFAVGAASGVALAGRWLNQRGRWWVAVLSTVVASVVLALLFRYVRPTQNTTVQLALLPVLLLLVALASYNLSRHRR